MTISRGRPFSRVETERIAACDRRADVALVENDPPGEALFMGDEQ